MENIGKLMELAKGEDANGDEDFSVIFGSEQLFNVTIIYVHGSFEAHEVIKRLVFAKPSEPVLASGLCSFGMGVESIGTMVCLVWANSDGHKLEHSLPVFIHEIVHVSQYILDWAGVKDSSGEVQAHLVQRESERILREMLHIRLPSQESTTKAVESILKEHFIQTEEDDHPVMGLPENGNEDGDSTKIAA